jgi:hypothetical protein
MSIVPDSVPDFAPPRARRSTRRHRRLTAIPLPRCIHTNRFGDDCRPIIIGSSRRDPPPLHLSPGPANYAPTLPDRRLPPTIHARLAARADASPTAGADLACVRAFPSPARVTIGARPPTDLCWLNDSPGPVYLPVREAIGPSHRIAPRRAQPPAEPTPAPGEYEPLSPPRALGRQIRGDGIDRAEWLHPAAGVPSPDAYFREPVRVRQPGFAIGPRSRGKRVTRGGWRIGIERFLITIPDGEIDPGDAMLYLRSHPEFRRLLRDVASEILAAKPVAPVGHLRDFFRAMSGCQKFVNAKEVEVHRYHIW